MTILCYDPGQERVLLSQREFDELRRYADKHKKDVSTIGIIEAMCAINNIPYLENVELDIDNIS